MKLKKETIKELGVILNEEFGMTLSDNDVEKLAYSLVGFFALLLKGHNRNDVRK